MYVGSVINSGALYTLQVSPVRRLYTLQMSPQFGGFMYDASVTNTEAL